MKKKGFTLVELIAVIAILSILVIIVLPNVVSLFNQAKQDTFESEVIQIFKEAQQEWAIDSLTGTGNVVYARSNEGCTKELDLSGRTNVKYYVEVDKYGNVIKLFATDGTYQYEYRGDGLKLGTIGGSQQVADLQDSAILTVNCNGAKKNGKDVTAVETINGTNVGKDSSNNDVVNTIPSGATGLYKIMAEQAYMDNVKSPFVTSYGINFNEISSDTNGKGIYEVASTKNDVYPIYYYRGAVTNNNVKFGSFCWKAVRTTNTGGVKLIYNGRPDSSGHCTNTTGTSTQIKTSTFNNSGSPVNVGYMYGTPYTVSSKALSTSNIGYKFGKSVTYSNGTYTLTDVVAVDNTNYNRSTAFNKNHYTCFSTSDTCAEVKYVYDISDSTYYYITISGLDPNGRELIDVVRENMFKNDNNSTAKTEIENWYKNNMTGVSSKIEDTVYCGDRTLMQVAGWSPTQTNDSGDLMFNGFERSWGTHKPTLVCERPLDRYTVSSSIGNGKLAYSVGLLTADEIMYAGGEFASPNSTYYLHTNQSYWAGSPVNITVSASSEIAVLSDGSINGSDISNSIGLRPVVSLSKDANVSGGNGTANNPYVIGNSIPGIGGSPSVDVPIGDVPIGGGSIEKLVRYEVSGPETKSSMFDHVYDKSSSNDSITFQIIIGNSNATYSNLKVTEKNDTTLSISFTVANSMASDITSTSSTDKNVIFIEVFDTKYTNFEIKDQNGLYEYNTNPFYSTEPVGPSAS